VQRIASVLRKQKARKELEREDKKPKKDKGVSEWTDE